ncbi:potassium voltage-gated channel protein Shaw [Lingula anatina]|uniref:Potassium voltage-gated channel protein Shaw n=1 Tax=Lingula anatina TaxID=7574 RepID=A0A1S3HNF1_LINAN|nr:potassium voltage-gated channel protein Shaw [Lingula anatina]XP_013387569.1 potassium voltage-gated channel protein Shaw [Lingula anatina]|eukprot:XP_013387567.1 potassium voltage-gated channel protein Shaw [Lingula anatina]
MNGDVIHAMTDTEQVTASEAVPETLLLNIGGDIHEVGWKTLQGKKGKILPNFEELKKFYRPDKNDFFFDRHPDLFASVLSYYRTGELHIPVNACAPAVKAELQFWGIDDSEMAECCWGNYSSYQKTEDMLAKFDSFLGKTHEKPKKTDSNWEQARSRIWNDLENPDASCFAKAYAAGSLMFVVLSIIVFVLASHPYFQVTPADNLWTTTLSFFVANNETLQIITDYWDRVNSTSLGRANKDYALLHPAMVLIDVICASFFTLDIFIRFIFSPSKARFFTYPLSIIDVLAIAPFYAELVINIVNPEDMFGETVFGFINILKIARVFRIFRLAKSYTGMKVILYSLKEGLAELTLTLIILVITMLICSTLMFYADNVNNEDSMFTSIPLTLWWSIVTLTTVGYGEFVPTSGLGYIIGAISAFFGVVCLAMTVPIVVNNFMLYYSHARTTPKKRDSNVDPKTVNGASEGYQNKAYEHDNQTQPTLTTQI